MPEPVYYLAEEWEKMRDRLVMRGERLHADRGHPLTGQARTDHFRRTEAAILAYALRLMATRLEAPDR